MRNGKPKKNVEQIGTGKKGKKTVAHLGSENDQKFQYKIRQRKKVQKIFYKSI